MSGRTLRAAGFGVLLLLETACTPQRVSAPPPTPATKPEPKVLVVLLPGAEGNVGDIVVRNIAGTAELKQAYAALRLDRNPTVPPPAPFVMDVADLNRTFGAVLAALPSAERQFVLYFEGITADLLRQSSAQAPEIVRAIAERHSTDLTITGHTDTTGAAASNYRLGLERAQRVAALLESQGVERSILSIESHGDTDLAVKTPPNTPEPRNRRVEVVVR